MDSGSQNFQIDIKQVFRSGYMQKKSENASGGKKASNRSWQTYFFVARGADLIYFETEDKVGFFSIIV